MGRIKSRCCIALHDLYEIGEKMPSNAYAKGYFIDQRRPASKDDKVIVPRGAIHYNVSGAFTKKDQYFLHPPRYSEIIVLTDKKKASLYQIAEEMEDYIIDLSKKNNLQCLLLQFKDWQIRIQKVIPRCSTIIKKKVKNWLIQTSDIVEYISANYTAIKTERNCVVIQDILFELAKELSV